VIGKSAFSCCTKLQSIQLSSSLITIEYAAFAFCSSVKTIILPALVSNIGAHAFKHCECLKEITIPASICTTQYCMNKYSYIQPDKNYLGDYAFENCYSLRLIIVENPLLAYQLIKSFDYEYNRSIRRAVGIPDATKIEFSKTTSQRDKQIYDWMINHRCRHCGGKIGVWNEKCKSCGKSKDYKD